MHQQTLRFQVDARGDESLRTHADRHRRCTRQAFFRAAELCGVFCHLVPLGKALLHVLLEALEALQCARVHHVMCFLPAMEDTEPR